MIKVKIVRLQVISNVAVDNTIEFFSTSNQTNGGKKNNMNEYLQSDRQYGFHLMKWISWYLASVYLVRTENLHTKINLYFGFDDIESGAAHYISISH